MLHKGRMETGMEMASQKKWGRKGYLQDFKGSRREGYVYTGESWQAYEPVRRRLLAKLWGLQALMLAAVVLPGLMTTAGLQNTFYVILPYVFWLISVFYLAYMLGSMTFGGNPMRAYVYERTVARFIPCAAASFAGAALTALGLCFFLINGGEGQGAFLCFICCILQGICFFLIKRWDIAKIWTKLSSCGK